MGCDNLEIMQLKDKNLRCYIKIAIIPAIPANVPAEFLGAESMETTGYEDDSGEEVVDSESEVVVLNVVAEPAESDDGVALIDPRSAADAAVSKIAVDKMVDNFMLNILMRMLYCLYYEFMKKTSI